MINYKGKFYEGEREDIIIALRKDRASYQEIGELLGCTRANIALILNRHGFYGHREWPELENLAMYDEQSDEAVALKLGLTVHKVVVARKELGLKKDNLIRLGFRRKALCRYLIGKKYLPGKLFVPWLDALIEEHFTGAKYEAMHNFYVVGSTESTSEKVNRDSRRVVRSHARQELKLHRFNIKDLLEEEVIVENNSKGRDNQDNN